MKKKTLIIFALLIIFIVLLIRYGFIIILWLTTPRDGELRTDEKILFQKIKKDDRARDVWREPRYNITAPKDTTTYTIIVKDIPCQKDTTGLKDRAQRIKSEIDKLNLHSNFYKYEVLYKCSDGKEYNYKFLR